MKEWANKFWMEHGDRLTFMFIATLFGLAFYKLFPDMKGEAKTILIGVAMLCYNKARSITNAGKENPVNGTNGQK